MSGEAGAGTGHPIGEDDDVALEAAKDTARLVNLDPAEAVVRALRVYRQLHRFRVNGDRVWVGQAVLYAQEWTWD